MALTKVSTGMINTSAASVDLDIDNGTFYVDVNSGRVGVSNSSPATALDVTGTATATLFSGSGASLTSIPNAALDNSSITINSYSTSLGGTVTLSTSDVGEGTNLYYTDARWDTKFAAASTTGLSEGTNLYYTDARADARVSLIVDAAPETLNTLNELAAALGDDANFSTTVTNSIATKLPLAGGTLTGSLSLGDNVKAQFGAGNDLQIYHTGSASVIADSGDGSLFIQGESQIVLGNVGNIESYAIFNADGAVQLRHNNAQKFATTTTGIDITGTATAAAFETDAGGTFTTASGNDLNIVYPASRSLFIKEGSETHVTVDNVGNVGIGTSLPAAPLHTQFSNNDGGVGGHLIKNTNTGTTSNFASLSTHAVNGTIQGTFGSAHYSTWGGAVVFAGSQSAHPLKIITGNAVRATFDTSGNVGIGTDSPNQLLHLSGNGPVLALGSSGTSDPRIDFYDQSTTTIGAGIFLDQDQDTLRILRTVSGSATDGIAINASGNVGIGTSSPTAAIHATTASIGYTAKFINTNGASDANGLLIQAGTVSTEYALNVANTAGTTNFMVVKGDGNVGIGTTTPSDRLVVQKDSANIEPLLVLKNDNTTDDNGTSIDFSGKDTSGNNIIYGRITAKYTNHATEKSHMIFTHRNDIGTFSEWMRVTHDGNVGIGDDSPDFKLAIRTPAIPSGSAYAWPLDLSRPNTDDRGLSFGIGESGGNHAIGAHNGDITLGQTYGLDSNSLPQFYETMRVWHDGTASAGRVGIGTASPDSKLDVEADEDTWLARIYNTGSDANAQGLLVRSDATAAHDAPVMGVYADGGYKMLVKSTGNVGIGTTNPSTALDVAGDVTIGSARVSLPYLASKKIGPLSAAATQAKRFTIGRIYYTPAHWSSLWTAVRLNCQMAQYTQGSVEYVIYGYYSSTANDPLQIYVNEITGVNDGSAVPHKFKISLGSQIDSGWDHPTSGDVFYQDIYVDVDYYNSWTIEATVDSDVFSNTNAVSGDEWKVVLYDSPASVNINTFSDTKTVFKNYAVEFNGGLTSGAITSSGTVTATGYLRTSSNGIYGKMADEWHTANALRGGNFSADIGNDTTVLTLFPASPNDESGNARAANDYSTGIKFMHLDPDNSWGSTYQGGQAWIGLKVESTPGQEFSSFVIATNASSTAGTFPTERLTVSKEGRVTINNVNDAYNFKAMAGDADSWFGVYDDTNNSANIIVTRSDGATSFQHLGHTGATTISGTLSSGAITTTGIVSVLTSPAANGVGDLKIIPSLSDSSGVGFAGQVIGVNIKNSVNTSNNPEQDSTWGGVTGATAIALQADDNTYGQFQVWTSPQDSTAGEDLAPRFWITGEGAATFAGALTVTGGVNPGVDISRGTGSLGGRVQLNNTSGNRGSIRLTQQDQPTIFMDVEGNEYNYEIYNSYGNFGIKLTSTTVSTTYPFLYNAGNEEITFQAGGQDGLKVTNNVSNTPDVWVAGTLSSGPITADSYEFNSNSIFYGKIGVASGPSFFYTGTATPGSFWDINNLSNGNLIMTLSDAGAMSIAGTLTQSASDERLKENIQPITNALEKLNLLRGVEFDWKDNIEGFSPEQKHETGVIAQEVEKVMPDAVVPAPFNKEYKTVHKDKLIALLIEAVKELQQEVELLKNNS